MHTNPLTKKVYIDVTESYLWEGEATGIIRVMDQLSVRFSNDQQSNVEFLVWDEKIASFFRIELDEILAKRVRRTASQQTGSDTTDYINIHSLLRVKIPLSRTVRRVVKGVKRNSAQVYRRRSVKFEAGAILFMPHGGVWGSKKYMKAVLNLQQTKQLILVPILYDLCPVLTPQFCSPGVRKIFNNYMREALVKFDLVLAISINTAENAKTWITSVKGGRPAPIEVFRLGDEIGRGKSKKPQGFNMPNDFVLCVGTIEARKNHACLYYAYKLANKKGINLPTLIIAGRKGWLSKDIYEIITTDPEISKKIIIINNADDHELNWLYANAKFSVFPAFYEGWGLPVAESLVHGVPCIASETSSIPEIAGDLVEYFSPYSPDELLTKMDRLYNDPKILAAKIAHIKSNYRITSWDDSYTQVCAILADL